MKLLFLRILNLDGFHFVPLYNNLKIEINLADSSENFYWYGCYPKHVVNFLQTHLKEADIFVDCGANFGLWTLIASQYVKKLGGVHSYEPNPEMYNRLEKNIAFNGLQERCNSYKLGLSSKSTSAYLNLDENYHQMGSMHTKSSGNQIAIDLVTFDSVKLNRINGMKIDVEGHELDVIKGAIQTLKIHKPWLVVELNNSFNNIRSISQWDVFQALTEIGYVTHFVTSEQLDPSFCRDIIFYTSTNSQKELFPAFL